MSARAVAVNRSGKRGRRGVTYAWIASLTIITIVLLYLEQIALLYVLATLGVTVLLVVVALANLDEARNNAAATIAPRPADDSAVIGNSLINPSAPLATDISTGTRTRNAKNR